MCLLVVCSKFLKNIRSLLYNIDMYIDKDKIENIGSSKPIKLKTTRSVDKNVYINKSEIMKSLDEDSVYKLRRNYPSILALLPFRKGKHKLTRGNKIIKTKTGYKLGGSK